MNTDAGEGRMNDTRPARTESKVASNTSVAAARDICHRDATATGYFCPICGHEFAPEEIGKKPHCRRCGYLESCCNPDASTFR
jgi:NADH pyrophosphatase NudC (nudix superfamily)